MRSFDSLEIEKKLGYSFRNKKLLLSAFTHSSYANESVASVESYERLEFLGDSLLGFFVAEFLYFSVANNEGKMTEERKKLVSREALEETITALGVFDYMRFGQSAKKNVSVFTKVKSDLYEAIVAAIYLDSGSNFTVARNFVARTLRQSKDEDFISVLNERVQKDKHIAPVYETRQSGDGFFSQVKVRGVVLGEGFGKNSREARRAAAKDAISRY